MEADDNAQLEYGKLAIRATPPQARVYVDGVLLGVVEDFNGTAQRMRLWPGLHRIEIWQDDYHPARYAIRIVADRTYAARYDMVMRNVENETHPLVIDQNPPQELNEEQMSKKPPEQKSLK